MYQDTFPSVFPFAAFLMLPKKLSMCLDSRRGNMALQPAVIRDVDELGQVLALVNI